MPYYRFAVDGKKVHDLIKNYVSESLGAIFKNDEEVATDEKLQSFFNEIRDPKKGDLRGFPAYIGTI